MSQSFYSGRKEKELDNSKLDQLIWRKHTMSDGLFRTIQINERGIGIDGKRQTE